MRFHPLAAALACGLFCGSASSGEAVPRDGLDEAIGRALAASKRPGTVIAITDRGSTRRIYVHGYADLKTRTPLTADSRFAIGSLSKAFTSIVLLQMAGEGRFDPSAPLTRFLPSLKIRSPYPPITGRDVMSHTAGLPDYLEDAASSRYVITELQGFSPTYAPGTHWRYSNTGYQLLGFVVEDLEKRPYADVIQERIFTPLGMAHSSAVIDDAQRTQTVLSYTRWPYDGSYVEAPWYEYTAGDGSIVSTAEDMCAYLRFLLNRGAAGGRQVLSEAAFAELTKPVMEDYAYGLWVKTKEGHRVYSHSGSIYGFHNYMEVHPDGGFGVIILSNGGIDEEFKGWLMDAVVADTAGVALPALPPGRPDLLEAPLADYAGTYHGAAVDAAVSVTVKEVNGVLTSSGSLGTHTLERIGVDTFRVAGISRDTSAWLFTRAEGGTSAPLVGLGHGDRWFATGAAIATAAAPAGYAAYVGHYVYSGPEGPVARIYLRDGALIAVLGMEEELYWQPLEPLSPAVFRVGREPESPERAVFDTVIDGKATRLTLSGVPLYRRDTP